MRGKRLTPILAACAVVLVAMLAACTGPGSRNGGPVGPAAGGLHWRRCGSGQCATLAVPLNYASPSAGTITLALFRLPATGPGRRIGSLLINPGGPGESGVAFLRDIAPAYADRLRARFDLVSFDPRGTGSSDPVRCGPSFSRLLATDWAPQTAAQRSTLGSAERAFAAACKQRLGKALAFVDTTDVARDMDRIRAALGDKQVSYLGYSYGTELGQVYANMFPGHVRAMVLDGVVDLSVRPVQGALSQARGVEQALDRFLAGCAASRSCAFHNGGHSGGAFDRLAARIAARPLRVGSRVLGPTQFWMGVVEPLYSDDDTTLAAALAAAAAGNGAPLLRSADSYDEWSHGSYGTLLQANQAINCVDGPPLAPPADFPKLAARFRAAAPRYWRFALYASIGCSYWPERPRPPALPIRAKGAPPILVIGTTGDPFTPYHQAVAVSRQLQSGVLLTAVGATHTALAGLGVPCDSLVIPYLITRSAPRTGSRCPSSH
jgi:pimeloyl-ACP methyl ester carboxylesterase